MGLRLGAPNLELGGTYISLGAGSSAHLNLFDLPPVDAEDAEERDPIRAHVPPL
jgi:hypothetical protein